MFYLHPFRIAAAVAIVGGYRALRSSKDKGGIGII